jgi:hypothetical protein
MATQHRTWPDIDAVAATERFSNIQNFNHIYLRHDYKLISENSNNLPHFHLPAARVPLVHDLYHPCHIEQQRAERKKGVHPHMHKPATVWLLDCIGRAWRLECTWKFTLKKAFVDYHDTFKIVAHKLSYQLTTTETWYHVSCATIHMQTSGNYYCLFSLELNYGLNLNNW